MEGVFAAFSGISGAQPKILVRDENASLTSDKRATSNLAYKHEVNRSHSIHLVDSLAVVQSLHIHLNEDE